MVKIISRNLAIAVFLFILSINFALLSVVIAALCHILELKPATTPFLQTAGITMLLTIYLGIRIKMSRFPVFSDHAAFTYWVGMVLSFALAAGSAILFTKIAPSTHWMTLTILSCGLFLVLCIAIKLNDLRYSID